MEIIATAIAFLFLVLIVGGALSYLSFIVFRNNATFNANLLGINNQLGAAFNEFKAGIEANQKLAEDLNKILGETQPGLQEIKHFEDRVRLLENTVKLKTTRAMTSMSQAN